MTFRPTDAVLIALNTEDARDYPEFGPRMVVTFRTPQKLRGWRVSRVYVTRKAQREIGTPMWDRLMYTLYPCQAGVPTSERGTYFL